MDYATLFIIALFGIALGLYLGGNKNRGRYRNPYNDPRSGGYPPYPPYYPPFYPYYPPPGYPNEQYPREPENDWTGTWPIVLLFVVIGYLVLRSDSSEGKQQNAVKSKESSLTKQPANRTQNVAEPKRLEERTVPGNNPNFYYQEAE